MSLYEQLDKDFVKAIQSNQLNKFITDLSKELSSTDYMRWLFLARACDSKGDIENAKNAYIHLMRIADPTNPSRVQLLGEVQKFINRYGIVELVMVADQCFGPNSLNPPVTLRGASLTQNKQSVDSALPERGKSSTPKNNAIRSTIISSDGQKNIKAQIYLSHEGYFKAYKAGDRSYKTILKLAEILQHSRKYDEALSILDEGIKVVSDRTNFLALLTLKAQILSSQQRWNEAVEAYEDLIEKEARPAAKRTWSLQLVQIYSRLAKFDRAREIIEDVLQSNPQDQLAMRLRSSLNVNPEFLPSYTDNTSQILQVLDIPQLPPNLRSELVSPMLLNDLDNAQFHDEIILLKGGHPDPDDAERLMKLAEKTRGSEFAGRYPLFLEAAKAYSKLPEGSYTLEKFQRALNYYSMLKGGALVAEFRRQVDSGKVDLEELKRLRDSATSYYLESLVLQAEVNLNQIILQITNYLRIQLAYVLFKRYEPLHGIFDRNLDSLLSYCLRHSEDNVARIAYEIVVSCGAAGEKIWRKMQDKAGGAFTGTLSDEVARKGAYKILSEMSNQKFTEHQKPRDVLQAAFFARFDQTTELHRFFHNLLQIPLTQASLPELHEKWQKFPLYRGPLLDTDIELRVTVGKILDTLRRYQARSTDERTSILYTSRTSIEQLLSFIQQYPTYWGRVGFGRLLTEWRVAIQKIEKKRLEEFQPRLVARLETETFSARDEHVEGGIILENAGRATAESAKIIIQLSTEEGEILHKEEINIEDEIAVGGKFHRRLSFDTSLFSEDLKSPYRINLHVSPVFRQEELESVPYSFTLEIGVGELGTNSKFTREDIPWNELEIPPKHLFKGREQFIDHLAKHLCSPERQRTYLLYGLTRTGKSSILKYLGDKIDLQPMSFNGLDYRFISFGWELAEAATLKNARDMWKYFILTCILEKCEILLRQGRLEDADMPVLKHPENVRFRDWEDLIKHFHHHKLYPVFLIDEFSYYRNLVDNGQVDASFLASIRSFAIGNRASFVFAGTYDLKEFIRDPKYAVTGQLINVTTEKVSRIDPIPASELVQVMEPNLHFTLDAIEHILYLSYRIPYFIQIICKSCAIFALKMGRSILGFPEVETVVQTLAGERENAENRDIGVGHLPSGVFMNNLQADSDPVEYQVLLSSICHLVADSQRPSDNSRPRMVTLPEIQGLWHRRGVDSFQAKFAAAISELIDREVLIEGKDEGLPAYRISVDLFRRWWANEHSVIEREIDKLKGN